VVRRLGGVSNRWRFDRMATVCQPGSGRITASFAPVAIHYLLTELPSAFSLVSTGVSRGSVSPQRC
jgi:hypothetical protein